MESTEHTLLLLGIILTLGLVIPELLKKFRLPYVGVLIVLGSLLGTNGVDIVGNDAVISFFGFLGFTFLMFMAGLETDFETFNHSIKKITAMALFNSLIPGGVGVLLARLFGYGWETSLLLGIIFMSSSVAIIIPSIKETKFLNRKAGQRIISVVVMEDILSLIVLAIFFQNMDPVTSLPLPLYFMILFGSIVTLRYMLPRVANYFIKHPFWRRRELYESELRFIIVMLIGVLLYFSLLGVHPIVAAFLVGLFLSQVLKNPKIYDKLHTLGYGLFVPVFFFVVGMEMDLSIITKFDFRNFIFIAIILSLFVSKFTSGYVAGRIGKLKEDESVIFGIVSSSQLTTTLATTYTAGAAGLLDTTLVTAIGLLVVVTAIIVPILLRLFSHFAYKKRPVIMDVMGQ